MAYQSESALENKLIEQLVSKGYQWVPEVRSEATMIANFRTVLEKRNSANIGEEPLTNKEFERLMTQINGKSIFDSAKILRDKVLLKRDNGKNLYLELFNTKEWCKNTFQVTNQISMEGKYTNRYDVTLLINGLPLVQVELKRSGVDMTEAFNQIMRYRMHTYTGLFRYIQIFVISNSQETRYFSNSDGEILKSQMFYWSDVENNRINVLSEFAESFMEKCHLAKMIARYMVLNETDKILMVMRPYQVYAVEALVRQALETKNNGYIWHTTGSGKTLTSFKASQIIAQEESIEKVFFLVDRKDLDSQTLAEFNKFEADSVDMTDNTYKLLKQMGDRTKPLILTTIQKMANAVKSGRKVIDSYREDRVVFIIDEAVVLPHGVLFRGAAEGGIRQYLIEEKNYLDAVIGLPANVFYGTSIPTCILVFKKCRQVDDTVLFIDASNEFEKAKNQNNLTDANVEKIVNTYEKREAIDKYSYVANLDEIKENDYNLNIPRYVDTFEEEEQISLEEIATAIQQTEKEIKQAEKELFALFGELHGTTDEAERELRNALAKLMNSGDGNE